MVTKPIFLPTYETVATVVTVVTLVTVVTVLTVVTVVTKQLCTPKNLTYLKPTCTYLRM